MLIKPNYYFKGETCLNNHFNNDVKMYNNVYICPYNVNNNGKYPFLRFILNNCNKLLFFYKIVIFKNFYSKELIYYAQHLLFTLLMIDDFDEFSKEIFFKGFYEYNNNLYLFFDLSICNFKLNDIYLSNTIWLCLLDEIVNHKNVCNIPVENNVTDFFINNQSFCFLLDNYGLTYEIPIIGFVEKNKNLNFTYIFGQSKSNSLLGPFYYFCDLYNIFINPNKNNNSGIVRFALFIGVTKYFENNDIDDSDTKKHRLFDKSLNQDIEKLTINLDFDGKWSTNGYDSAYIKTKVFDNNNVLFEKSIIVLKEFSQQIVLSYHYINFEKCEIL